MYVTFIYEMWIIGKLMVNNVKARELRELGSLSLNLIKIFIRFIEVEYCILKLVDMALRQRKEPPSLTLMPSPWTLQMLVRDLHLL
jgi:hypothetical protein